MASQSDYTTSLEKRLTALEQRANRYRNAFALMGVALAGVVLTGATATDDVQDVVKTKELVVLNDAGRVVVAATGVAGDGRLVVNSKTGGLLFYATGDNEGNGNLRTYSKTGKT